MTGEQIFERISANRKRIEEITDYTTFILNGEVVQLQAEIDAL